MRLFELSLPAYEQAEQVLRKAGWELYGEGYYANVYGKDTSNYVLKLFEYDRSYVDYLKLIEQHPNQHFPKIRGRLRVTPTYHAVRMEKLTMLEDNGRSISGMLNAYMIAKHYKLNNIQENNLELFDKYALDHPELVKALDLIDENLIGKYRLDMHGENIMQRADGTIVIIDPIRP